MADSRISAKTTRTVLDGTEQLPINYSGSPFKILVSGIKDYIIGLFQNKATVLDNLSVSVGGKLAFNGTEVQASATTAAGSSTEVQFRNASTGALDSDPLFKYDKATGVLNAGNTINYDPVGLRISVGSDVLITDNGNNSVNIGSLEPVPNGATAIGIDSTASATHATAVGGTADATGSQSTAIGSNTSASGTGAIAIGNGSDAYDDRNFSIGEEYIEGNMPAGTRWFRVNAAQLIRAVEVTAIAHLVAGTVTAGTANTLTDSSKVFLLNKYTNSVVKKTSITGEVEQRVILSNTTGGQVTVDRNWTNTPITTDTYKIITATVITSDNLSSIYRFDLSGGYDHAVILPLLSATFNRANVITYIEGHSGTAKLHGFPSAGSGALVTGGNEFELVANAESVELISHVTATPHWDLKASSGIFALGEATWSPQVITTTQSTFRPLDANLTIKFIRRFSPVLIGGSLWAQYTANTNRILKFAVNCDVTLNGTPASIITIGFRHYVKATGITTDYTFPGSNITISGNGSTNTFVVQGLFEMALGDRFQVLHKNNNNTNYTIIPQLVVN